ncbi:RICIN domain-containing protein [Anaerosacchariphilus polymeriproducens]|uniref:Ricin B lectin domain-containing protein n=1 Tax=Anaerosacchariphilus polymeriproducens TaxID=1812858 RepID=A0A371AY61_9FIRM|nr:RICIN domain-containing protein [Anaerosacchariphilus polymeriproducens]RDU24506.1 hypothetical protein DWV06_03295 [Anaerosacchariphilus polymeriproducens]
MIKNIKKLFISTVLSFTVLTSFAMPHFIGGISNIAYAADLETFPEEQIEEGVYQIISASSHRNLDVYDAKDENGTKIQIMHSNGNSSQKFRIKKAIGGWYKVIAMCSASNRCLDVYDSNSINGNKIQIFDDNATAAQRWKFLNTNNDGSYLIASKICDNLKVLDVRDANTEDGAIVQLNDYNGNRAQKWYFVKVG